MTQWDNPNDRETRAYRQPDQPQYGQPQYGQSPYGQGPQGDQYGDRSAYEAERQRRARFEDSTNNPFGAASDQAFGIVGTVLALLGGILGIVTLTGLEWFSTYGPLDFADVHNHISAGNIDSPGFSTAYFGWLAWVFLVVAVIAGVMASFPSPALRAFRVIGTVVGFAAAGLSFLAIQYNTGDSYVHFLKDARIGFYLMVIAYILAGTGAAIGPRKV